MDNLRYNSFRWCWHVQWLNDQWHARCKSVWMLENPRNSRGVFAFEYVCQEDCGVECRSGRTGDESPDVFHPSSIRFICAIGEVVEVVHGLRSTTWFADAHGHHKTKNWGLSSDTPILNRGAGGMGLLLQLFHRGFLEDVAM